MIVLPNTPPIPKPLGPVSTLSPNVVAARAALPSALPSNPAESTRYVLQLEAYLDLLFTEAQSLTSDSSDLQDIADAATQTVVTDAVPWADVSLPTKLFRKSTVSWHLSSEIAVTIVALALMYARLGAELMNELIESVAEEYSPGEADQKWKSVAEYYRTAMGLATFGGKFHVLTQAALQVNPTYYAFIEKVGDIGIQMSILCKSSWSNRAVFVATNTFDSTNNGVLCRVAIYVLNEVKACQNLASELLRSTKNDAFIDLKCQKWPQYLDIYSRYVSAYCGLFLAIEYYQKDKLGSAIGLVNFSLLSLQSKNVDTKKLEKSVTEKKSLLLGRVKEKFVGKRNDRFISNLQSISSLNMDKSVFLESSGVVLNDLSFLFDQLVLLHLKLTKENDNLKFDEVVDWKDIQSDSKWPIGTKIPSTTKEYVPTVLRTENHGIKPDFTGRGSYF